MNISRLQSIGHLDIHHRKIRDSFWIQKLQTITPGGLNQNKGVGDLDMGDKGKLCLDIVHTFNPTKKLNHINSHMIFTLF